MSSIRTKVFFPAQQNSASSSPYHRAHHSNEIRRWKVASFQELQERVQKVLSNSDDVTTQYRFEYLDDVNDWIVLEHPDEWEEAVASSTAQNVLVIRVIPRVVTPPRRQQPQRPPTRRGAHCASSHHCPRKAAQQLPCQALLSSGLAGALQALPFIIQLAAPASPKAESAPAPQAKRTVPIDSPRTAPEHIEIRRTKSVPVPVESAQEGPVEIPVTKSAPKVVRRIPIEDAAEEVPVQKNTSIEAEAPQQSQAVEIPVNVAPASPVRSIPIEDAAQDEDDVPLVEKEEAKPLDVEMSGIIENDYTIENDEDAHEIIVDEDVDEDKEDEVPAPQQEQSAPQAEERPQFQNEEDILQSMGFQDSKLNFHLLRHHNGNMEKTINSLLQLEQ